MSRLSRNNPCPNRAGDKEKTDLGRSNIPIERPSVNQSPSKFLDGDSPDGKIDLEPIITQHERADQDLVAIDKRCLYPNRPAIEWEIDKEDFFLDSLICCQKRRCTADEPRVHVRS